MPGIKVYFQNPSRRSGSAGVRRRVSTSSWSRAEHGRIVRRRARHWRRGSSRCRNSPEVTSDLLIRSPQLNVRIDRDKATSLGVSAASDRGGSGERLWIAPGVHHLRADERVPRRAGSEAEYQRDPTLLSRLYVRSDAGVLVPIDSLVEVDRGVAPLTVTHAGQLPAVTLSFDTAPGVSSARRCRKSMTRHGEELPPT